MKIEKSRLDLKDVGAKPHENWKANCKKWKPKIFETNQHMPGAQQKQRMAWALKKKKERGPGDWRWIRNLCPREPFWFVFQFPHFVSVTRRGKQNRNSGQEATVSVQVSNATYLGSLLLMKLKHNIQHGSCGRPILKLTVFKFSWRVIGDWKKRMQDPRGQIHYVFFNPRVRANFFRCSLCCFCPRVRPVCFRFSVFLFWFLLFSNTFGGPYFCFSLRITFQFPYFCSATPLARRCIRITL